MEEEQIIYIGIDDSGQLNNKESYFAYGTVVLFGQKEINQFTNGYRCLRNEIWCKDCYKDVDELKGYTLELDDKIRLLNVIYKYNTAGLFVNNSEISKEEILSKPASGGRYKDYILKLLIKDVFIKAIRDKKINPHSPVNLIIRIDDQATKTDGIYSLEEGIYEEFKVGISNFNYGFKTTPILFDEFHLNIKYSDSKNNLLVQAADLVAHDVWRHKMFNNFNLKVGHLKKFP